FPRTLPGTRRLALHVQSDLRARHERGGEAGEPLTGRPVRADSAGTRARGLGVRVLHESGGAELHAVESGGRVRFRVPPDSRRAAAGNPGAGALLRRARSAPGGRSRSSATGGGGVPPRASPLGAPGGAAPQPRARAYVSAPPRLGRDFRVQATRTSPA